MPSSSPSPSRSQPRFKGVFPVVPTTFDEAGGLDLAILLPSAILGILTGYLVASRVSDAGGTTSMFGSPMM